MNSRPGSTRLLDRKDWLFWGVSYGLALLAAVALYATAFLCAPRGYRFSGFIHASHDMYSYMAWSHAFSEPGFLVDNPYALTPQPGAYFNLYWFVIGKLMRFTGIPFLPLLYLSGVLSGGVMYLAMLAFMREFLPRRSLAWVAYLLAGFGSGLGWVVFFLPEELFGKVIVPNDISNPELLPFHDFLAYPHVALSFGLMVLIYLWAYQGIARDEWGKTFKAGSALMALGFFHPFHLVTILAVMGISWLAMTVGNPRRHFFRWAHPVFLGLMAAPPLAYFKYYLLRSPNFRAWESQIVNPTYGLFNTLLGFGPHVMLALVGLAAIALARRCPDRLLFILAWAGAALTLALVHHLFTFQSRILQGVIVPISVLAAVGFAALLHRLIWGRTPGLSEGTGFFVGDGRVGPEVWPPTAGFFACAIPLVLFTMICHGIVFGNQLLEISGRNPLFQAPINSKMIVRDEEMAAFEFLNRNVPKGSVVMSGMDTGVAMPAYARVRPFMGHFQGSPDARMRTLLMRSFYGNTAGGGKRVREMQELGIGYVWYGPDEARMGPFDPSGVPSLQRIFRNETVSIYRFLAGTS